MAQRRMVSLKIIDSAKFIKMPVSCQSLYFHLIARADDDGVVEAFNVMRMVGASEDDLKVLVAKQFATVLNEDLVTFINDWTEHNLIRSDRKIDSMYQDLLLQVVSDIQIKQKTERADRKPLLLEEIKVVDGNGTSHGQPNVSIGKVRLGEDRIEEVNKENSVAKPTRSRFTPPTLEEVKTYCLERNNGVDPVKWFNFYEAKGWMVGKNKMTKWKAAIHTWEKNDNNNQARKVVTDF